MHSVMPPYDFMLAQQASRVRGKSHAILDFHMLPFIHNLYLEEVYPDTKPKALEV